MSSKKKQVYKAIVDGATEGLTGKALYEFVMRRCPEATSKRIVRAALLALSDPDLSDRNILHVIYALAIEHRLADGVGDDDPDEGEDAAPAADTSKRASLPLPE